MTGSTAPLNPRGHTRITDRAMTRLVAAVAADALGLRPNQVSVDMADAGLGSPAVIVVGDVLQGLTAASVPLDVPRHEAGRR